MTIVIAGLFVTLGALVQGTAGFGLALVAVPFLAVLAPELVPVPMVLAGGVISVLVLLRERADADWAGVGWALLGGLPGAALGALAVATLPARLFLVVVAGSVLVCAALSALRWKPRPTVPGLLVAGVASGVAGTAASIGGPPVALLYQGESGPRVRATMAAYFAGATAQSVLALLVAGQVTAGSLTHAALLLPFLAVGFLLSYPARRLLDAGWVRPAVLVVSAVGAVLLLGTTLVP